MARFIATISVTAKFLRTKHSVVISIPIESIAIIVSGLAALFAYLQARSSRWSLSLNVFTKALDLLAEDNVSYLANHLILSMLTQ